MKRALGWVAALALLGAAASAACTGEPCAAPRKEMERQIREVCSPEAGGLVSSRFCGKCMKAGFPSYEKVSGKCVCGELSFGGACIAVMDEERVRAAVAFADTDCAEFFLPTEDAGLRQEDIDATPNRPEASSDATGDAREGAPPDAGDEGG